MMKFIYILMISLAVAACGHKETEERDWDAEVRWLAEHCVHETLKDSTGGCFIDMAPVKKTAKEIRLKSAGYLNSEDAIIMRQIRDFDYLFPAPPRPEEYEEFFNAQYERICGAVNEAVKGDSMPDAGSLDLYIELKEVLSWKAMKKPILDERITALGKRIFGAYGKLFPKRPSDSKFVRIERLSGFDAIDKNVCGLHIAYYDDGTRYKLTSVWNEKTQEYDTYCHKMRHDESVWE